MEFANKEFAFDIVGKIGSMALIRKEDNDIDYNIFAKLGAQLKPGMIWVSSGATEIGRLDYIKRNGQELLGDTDENKTDYSAQGQAILMQNYRQFISPNISVRQILVEHTHFNDEKKREHIRRLLIRSAQQGAVPIINYNDSVSSQENCKMEIAALQQHTDNVVECVDNDETAAVIANLVKARTLIILTSTDGIYRDPNDSTSLIRYINGKTPEDLLLSIEKAQKSCIGASRAGAQGAYAKLEYMKKPALSGTTIIIGSVKYTLEQLMGGTVPSTRISLY